MSLLSALRNAAGPAVAVELAATHVSGARVESRAGQPAIAAHAVEPLLPGAIVPSLTAANVIDRAAVVHALGRVLDRLDRPRRIALVVPDLAAKVSLVKFEQVPPRAHDLDQLVRWQVRKTAPFAIDEAQIGYVAGQRTGDGQEFLVSLARREIIEEYEQLAAAEGAYAGLVDLATLNVINAVLAGPAAPAAGPADWLLVNIAPHYATLVILRGPHVIFFRNRAVDTDGALADLVHQTAMYYEDRLGGAGFRRVILAGSAGAGPDRARDIEVVRRSLQERLAATVDTLDLRATVALTDRIAGAAVYLDTLAPLVGILLRGQETAA